MQGRACLRRSGACPTRMHHRALRLHCALLLVAALVAAEAWPGPAAALGPAQVTPLPVCTTECVELFAMFAQAHSLKTCAASARALSGP